MSIEKRLFIANDLQGVAESVELSRMRQLMRYRQADYEKDWDLSIALAQLLALKQSEHLELMLSSCMKRIAAYVANNPKARPFELPKVERVRGIRDRL